MPGTLGGGSGLRTLGIRSRKGDFRFGERDRHGADKRGSRNGEHVKRDRGFESISLQQRVRYEPASLGLALSLPLGHTAVESAEGKALVRAPDWDLAASDPLLTISRG